jgi:putative ABC transport system permease protein
VTAGRWTPGEEGAISVESGIAETLGLSMGDRLRFDMGGVQVEARITSLRKVDWGSMRANFFVMFPVGQVKDVPVTYLAAYRTPETLGFDNALVRQFPNITNVDLGASIAQVQRVLDQVIRAVEFLFAFTLAAGLVVLFAAVTATREERAREYAIMRAVGARASLLRKVQRAELLGVGLLAGFLASAVAVGVGWALARYVFDFAWTASPWVPLAGAGEATSPPVWHLNFIRLQYYAFITLTTTGYGDVTAETAQAQMLSVALAVGGTFYLAAVLGLLIGRYSMRQSSGD